MSPEQKATYMANGGTRCPYCGSTQIEGQEVEVDGSIAHQSVDCLECTTSWTDFYTLTDAEGPQ